MDVLAEVSANDPVRGSWNLYLGETAKVWCDGSSIALGVVIEIAGTTVEDTDWLRKKDDFNHINVAELEAALKEINLAIKWGLKSIELVTASATAHRWIQLTLTEKQRVKTKGADEIMVKRRLGVLRSLVDVCGLNIAVTLVPSHENKSDVLTRDVRSKRGVLCC